MQLDDLRVIGIIVGAHGLQGAVKVNPLSDFPERFDALQRVILAKADSITGEYRVKRVRWSGSLVHIQLDTIRNRETAEQLYGTELCVPDGESWPLPEGVYYISDLIGYRVVANDGTPLGILKGILESPQHILEISRDGGEWLVPFVADWVGRINSAERTIEILNWRRLLESETVNENGESDDH